MSILDILFAEMSTDIVDNLAYLLLLAEGIDQESIIAVGDDEIFQSGCDDDFVAIGGEESAFATMSYHLAILSDIAVGILWGAVVEGIPSAEVAPSEVGGEHEHIVSLLHDGIVDGDGGGVGEDLIDERQLLLRSEETRAGVEDASCLAVVALESAEDRLGSPDEHAAIPIELAGAEEYLCHLEVGFFGERLDLHKLAVGISHRLTALDITISGVWRSGLYSDGEECIMMLCEIEAMTDGLMELGFAED